MRYRIRHETRYTYGQPVGLCHNEARLQPRTTERQRCLSSEIAIHPVPDVRVEREDAFGNRVLYFAVQAPHNELTTTATSEIESLPTAVMVPPSPSWNEVAAAVEAGLSPAAREAKEYVIESPYCPPLPEIAAYAAASFEHGRPLLDAVRDLTSRIHRDFRFDPESTTIATPLAEVLTRRSGVCQDFAHLAIACMRAQRLPARYVSGYLETVPPAGQPKLQGADASHAWFAVYLPEQGWFDFDPTNDQIPGEQHVATAWGRDFGDVTPLKGVIFGGGTHTLNVGVDMMRLPPAEETQTLN